MAEAEKKDIAKLDFKIDDAISKLNEIDKKLKTISESSEAYAKKIGKNLGDSIKSTININTSDVEKKLTDVSNLSKNHLSKTTSVALQENAKRRTSDNSLANYQKKAAIDVAKTREKEEIKTTEKIKREHAKQANSVKTLGDTISNYAKTFLIYQGFNELKEAVRETVEEMVEVEYQMVQIDRVLGDSSLNIDKYRDKLIQMAYDYGNSFENVADITLRLAQAGFDAQESLMLTEKTLLALNTAELDATQATDDMVAVMAQWGLMTGTAGEQAEAYGEIIDKINKVADNFPTTSKDILDALKKTSSAFNLAGASIDETIAMIVAAETASQRGGKVIGTALSNIVQQLKAEGKINIMESLGIDVYKDSTKQEFNDIMDIISQLSQKMQELKDSGKENSAEMQNLLEVFTVFRRNVGASLLGEMAGQDSTYAQVLKTSIDSVGYSLQENEKHMQTAKAAQAQFNATLLELKTTVWDAGVEDVFRSMLLLGNDIAESVNFLIKTFGSIPSAIGLVTLAFTTLNKNVRIANNVMLTSEDGTQKIVRQYSDWILKIKQVIKEIKNQNTYIKINSDGTQKASTNIVGMAKQMGSLATKTSIATLKTVGLQAATLALNAALTMGLSVAITAIISGIQNLIQAEEKEKEKIQENIDLYNEKISGYKQEAEEIDSIIKKYEELSSSNASSPEDLIEIEELKLKINNILLKEKEIVSGINTEYGSQLDILKGISKEKSKQALEAQKEKVEETKKKNKGVKYDPSARRGDEKTLAPIKENITYLEKQLMHYQRIGAEGSKAYEKIEEKIKILKEQLQENNEVTFQYIEMLADIKKDEWFPEGTIKNAEDLEEILSKISEGDFSFSKDLIGFSEELDLSKDELETFKTILSSLIKNEFSDYANRLEEISTGNNLFRTEISETVNTLKTYEQSTQTLTAAQKEYNETGNLTVDTLLSIINSGYLEYVDIVNGKMDISRALALMNADAIKENAIASLQDQAAKRIQAIIMQDVTDKMKAQKGAASDVVSAQNSSASAVLSATEAYIAGRISLEEYNKVMENSEYQTGNIAGLTQNQLNQIQGVLGQLKTATNTINSIKLSPASRGSSGGGGSSSAAANQAKREAEQAAEAARKAEEEAYKARLKQFEDYVDEKERLEKRWVDKQKELGLLSNEDYMFITQQRIERYKKYLEELKKATWMNEEDRLRLEKEYTEEIEDLQVDYIGYLKDQLDDEIKALEDANKEKIELIEKEADARIEALRKVEDERDRLRETEDYEKERQSILDEIAYWEQRTGREAQEALMEAKNKLAELDAAWEDTQEDWTVEDQIKKIEEERDAEIKAIEEAQQKEIEALQAVYDAKVKLFAETGEIIYEGSVMQAESLYNAYKNNFIDPISAELQKLNQQATTATPPPAEQVQQYETYLIKQGDTLSKIARRYGTTVEKIMAANPYITNKHKIYAGKTLQIPKFHEGGIFGGNYEEGLALLKRGEVILKPSWSASLDRMMRYFDNLSSDNQTSITNGPTINVDGDLIRIEASIKNQSDIDKLEKKIEKMLKDKFNIKK